jgi:hypothetical protein
MSAGTYTADMSAQSADEHSRTAYRLTHRTISSAGHAVTVQYLVDETELEPAIDVYERVLDAIRRRPLASTPRAEHLELECMQPGQPDTLTARSRVRRLNDSAR